MSCVRTVLGDIDPSVVGHTAMHEHLIMFSDETLMAEELYAYKEMGGQTLVEVTTVGLVEIDERRSHAELLARLSNNTQVNLVAGTGFYKEPRLPIIIITSRPPGILAGRCVDRLSLV